MPTQTTESFTNVARLYVGKGAPKTPGWFLNRVNKQTGEEIIDHFTPDQAEKDQWVAQTTAENQPKGAYE